MRYTAALGGEPVMPDLRQVFRELVRFATELWNAVDDRVMSPFGVPWALPRADVGDGPAAKQSA